MLNKKRELQLELIALLDEKKRRANLGKKTPIGLVSVSGELVRTIELSNGVYVETKRHPQVYLPIKLEPVLTRPKRFIILIGGRGSAKSISAGDIGLVNMHDNGKNIMCIREYQTSIADSIHSLLKTEVSRLELSDATITEKSISFDHNGTYSKFAGLSRNPESVKSAHGFSLWLVEESQFLSDKSLKTLTPTARNKPKKGLPMQQVDVETDEVNLEQVSMIFCGNPASSEDPFSKRFINPFKSDLDKHGIYEDEMHLIIKINWSDNPWFMESGLEAERQFDYKNLPRSTYEWIWEGGFNDDIENALIKSEWFDACIDAHIKLGMKEFGITKVSHDPSDLGADPKAVCIRKGNIITEITDRNDIDVNEGSDWSLKIAIDNAADQYIWDVGGMGVSLKRDVNSALDGKHVAAIQYNGSHSVEDPDDAYEPSGAMNIQNEKTNKEICKNLRAQCYLKLRDRVYRTYRAVVHGEFCDPAKLISFSSSCSNLTGLRSEMCRLPIKPNPNAFEMYTKEEMRRKFKVRSQNLSDCVMMTEINWTPFVKQTDYSNYKIPCAVG